MSKFKKSLFLITLLCIALAFTACSQKNDQGIEDNVKATVNGKAISLEEYDDAMAYYKDYVEYQFGEGVWETEASKGLTYKELYEEYVMDEMTKSLLLVDAAEKEGITVTEEEKQNALENFKINLQVWIQRLAFSYIILAAILILYSLMDGFESMYRNLDVSKEKQNALENFKINFQNDEEYKSFLEQRGMTEEFIIQELAKETLINNYITSKIDSLKPNDDELKDIFDDMKMNMQVKASHILVDTEEEALKVIERINKGEDFAELAKELSTDTGSGANGGDLDYFNYAQMVKPFSEAAFALETGEVSQPVKSDFGYHIIKLTDKIVNGEITVESEKDKLIEYYKMSKFEDLLEQLKSTAEIVIN